MATTARVTMVTKDDLRLDVLPRKTAAAFCRFSTTQFVGSPWYLAGGTALALQTGHRESVDLDFFTTKQDIDFDALEKALVMLGGWTTTMRQAGTLYGELDGAKVSFIEYPFFIPREDRLHCGTIQLLTLSDIASMKIIAISQRGRKRDFVDMYWLCAVRGFSLENVLETAMKQYPQKHSVPHLLYSLTYFADAEEDALPTLHFKASWKDIKTYFEREVPPVAKRLLGLE